MKKNGVLLLFLILTFSLIHHATVLAESTAAKGEILKIKGEVFYQKGSQIQKLPLHQSDELTAGDVITTGKNASVDMQLEPTGDTLFIGENSEVFFIQDAGHIFVHVLKGKVFVSAEKRATEDEALYIMTNEETYKVLGTHFTLIIDPDTGLPNMFVGSGVVASQGNDGGTRGTEILPGHSYLSMPGDSGTSSLPIDPSDFSTRAGSDIIEAMIKKYQDIQEENQRLANELRSHARPLPGFPIMSEEEIGKYKNNLDALIPKLVSESINNGTVDEGDIKKIIDEVNRQGGPPLDLDDADQYKPELTPEEQRTRERIKQIEEQRKQEEQTRQQQMEEKKQQQQDLINRIEQVKKEQDERNQREVEKSKEEARKKLEERQRPTQPKPSRPSRPSRPSPEPSPRPDPVPEPAVPGEIEIKDIDVTSNSIHISWEQMNAEGEYEVWLEDVDGQQVFKRLLIEGNQYKFTNLNGDTPYDVVIKSGEHIVKQREVTLLPFKINFENPSPFFIQIFWDIEYENEEVFIDSFDYYKIYVNDELVKRVGKEINSYTFENLEPQRVYTIRVQAYNSADKILADSQILYSVDKPIQVNYAIDEQKYLSFHLETEFYEGMQLEVKLNGEKIYDLDGNFDNNFEIELKKFIQPINKVEVEALIDGQKIGYGYTNVLKGNFEESSGPELVFVNMSDALIYWDSESAEDERKFIIKNLKKNEEFVFHSTNSPYLNIYDLDPETDYEIIDNNDPENPFPFATSSESRIRYIKGKLTWELPDGNEHLETKVFINNIERQIEDINWLDEIYLGNLIDVKIKFYAGADLVEEYGTTIFVNLSTSIPE